MQNLEIVDVEKSLAPSWKVRRGTRRAKRSHRPHVLKKFFLERAISNKKIAIVLGCTDVTVGAWLNADYPPPPWREQQLWQLHDKVREWEGRNGRQFGF